MHKEDWASILKKTLKHSCCMLLERGNLDYIVLCERLAGSGAGGDKRDASLASSHQTTFISGTQLNFHSFQALDLISTHFRHCS